ncbi:MAG: ATP-dependent helicase HrpB [Actinomycetaceae bacterium]|nr:ATP-dependent helicase HrpB [Actinomycetaceae bacterium]
MNVDLPLPAKNALAPLHQALDEGPVVLTAPPASGKTTLVPPSLTKYGKVIVTGPRRIAVRSAANYLAKLLGEPLGERVGMNVRGQKIGGRNVQVEFVTTGILLRRLLADPELNGVGALVLDEVHERQIEMDLALAMSSEVAALREDLKLVVMSATLDATALAERLDAQIVAVDATMHPTQICYEPARQLVDEHGMTALAHAHAAKIVMREMAGRNGETALVFVPARADTEKVAARIHGDFQVCVLHGGLNAREQDFALSPPDPTDPPKIVCTTAVAESSLTVPGVYTVIDSGLSREARYDVRRDYVQLVSVTEAKSSATQRAGRAARLGPGRVFRLYDKITEARMRPHPPAEIETADLSAAVLMLASWGSPRGVGMSLPTLPKAALTRAEKTLFALGAIDADGRATTLGKQMVKIPAHPALARALIEGAQIVGARAAAEGVATLTADTQGNDTNLESVFRLLRPTSEFRREVVRLEKLAHEIVLARSAVSSAKATTSAPVRPAATDPAAVLGLITAMAYPSRIAAKDGDTYLMAGGGRVSGDFSAPFLAIASWGGSRPRIYSAVPISENIALRAGAHMLTETTECFWENDRAVARKQRFLGDIQLNSTPITPSKSQRLQAWQTELRRVGSSFLFASNHAESLRARLAFLARALGDPWPELSEDALVGTALEMDKIVTMEAVLQALLPWPDAARLDELAPPNFTIPTGKSVPIFYSESANPRISVKLQACFGLLKSPEIAGKSLQVELLSPAGRPLAVSGDLAYFWREIYPQVRAEMRGRYPKHPWPQDPSDATPTFSTNKRRR